MGDFPRAFDIDFEGEPARREKVRTRHEKRMRRVAATERDPFGGRRFMHVALEAQVAFRAPVFATESRQRVEAAARALFPDARFSSGPDGPRVEGEARDLARFAEILRLTRIRDTAREVLRRAVGEDGAIRLRLNKQAALAEHVNFVEGGDVLGALDVEIRCAEPQFLVEELTWIEGESDERLLGTKLHTLPARRAR